MNINEPRHGGGFVLPFFNDKRKDRQSTRPSSLKSNRVPFLNVLPDNVRALPYIRGLCLVIAQILGGITAAAICSALFPGPLTVRTNLGGGTSVVQGLFIEMFLTAELVFTIFMLAAEKHKGTFIAPVGIGLSLFIAELTGVYFTGGSVNPARSFGPSVVSHAFHTYHWIYWVGPILGSLLASGFYLFIKMLEYETANPGQDREKADDDVGEHFNPDLDTSHPRVSFAPEDYVRNTEGTHGAPREYGMERRPFSESPAPPHANDQFAGLSEGGMHAEELVKPNTSYSLGGDSDRTLSAAAPVGGVGGAAVGGQRGQGVQHKSAMRPASRGNGGPINANGRSARSNAHKNRNMANNGIPADVEFFDEK